MPPKDTEKETPPNGAGTESRSRTRTAQDTEPPETLADVIGAAVPGKEKRSAADKQLQEAISGTYSMIGGLTAGLGMQRNDSGIMASGLQIIESADAIAEAWMDLADRNPKVRTMLKRFTEYSAAGVLVSLHFAMFVPLLTDRGIIPGAMMPVPMTPEPE